jgi:3-isopropylmalate dehydrogenase
MAAHNLFLLPGDGIGPEVMAEVEAIIAWMDATGIAKFKTDRGLVGGCAYDAHGKAISEEDMEKAQGADAVLFGAVGGPRWDKVAYVHRPEAAIQPLPKPHPSNANSWTDLIS